MKMFRQQPQSFSSADNQRNDDGDGSNGHVVVEFADGLYEGPAVSSEHQQVIGGIDQGHSRREQDRENQDGPERKSLGGFGRRDSQYTDFRSGIKSEAEQDPQR